MSDKLNKDAEDFFLFIHNLFMGDYAQSYEAGWDDCLHKLGRDKHNPFSNKAYPLEHKAYNHGFEDAIVLLTEWEKHWRGGKAL